MSDQINIPYVPADASLQNEFAAIEVDFVTKDSGKREQFASGMKRDTQDGKLRVDLAFDGPMLRIMFREGPKSDVGLAMCDWYDEALLGHTAPDEAAKVLRLMAAYEGGMGALITRYAGVMTRGAVKYDARNWMQANGSAEAERFISSATRHFLQWFRGDKDEDHAAAVVFNLNGYEYVRRKMNLLF